MEPEQPTTWPAPPKVPAPSPSSVPVDFWKRKAFGVALTALVVAATGWLTSYVQSRNIEGAQNRKVDTGWNATRTAVTQQGEQIAALHSAVEASNKRVDALVARVMIVPSQLPPVPSAEPPPAPATLPKSLDSLLP